MSILFLGVLLISIKLISINFNLISSQCYAAGFIFLYEITLRMAESSKKHVLYVLKSLKPMDSFGMWWKSNEIIFFIES